MTASAPVALPSAMSPLAGHVLVAEDNPVNQDVAMSMLESLGCRVTAVGTGTDAVEAVERATFDAVLMDMQMPVMDGLEATRAIRLSEENANRRHVPIIALTANAFATDAEACFAAGMDEYLSKPFTLSQLHARLARWLSAEPPASVAATPGEPAGPVTAEVCDGHPTQAARPEPVLDRKALDALRALRRPGRPDVVEKIVSGFLRSAPEALTTMREALSRGDAVMLHRAAHGFKSSSGNVGAMTLSGYCRELEALGRANALTDATAVLDRLTAEYTRVEAALTDELQTV